MKRFIFLFVLPVMLNAVTLKHTRNTIVIDGNLEKVWYTVAPLTGFTQTEPEEGKPASEKTEVYILTDNKNLYVAFKCFTKDRKPQVRLRGWDDASGDRVTLYLDPFGDKRTGYYFTVSAAGTQEDGTINRGGIAFDYSWDGVWFAKSKITNYGYNVEMKIPFKSIRYSSTKWGIQFARDIPVKGEDDYWKPVPQISGFRITQFGELEGVEPESKGRFLEIYPVGIVRYNDKFKLSGGLDLSYNPSSEFGFNVTILPDFAQIEADPFQVNLSQYALYLRERRPFFVAGQNMFRIRRGNDFNIGPGPIDVLYTRNIGKIVDDSIEVPIYGGLKFTTRGNGFEGAAIYVNTGSAGSEPMANYVALRGAKNIFSGAQLGITYTGKEAKNDFTRVATIDGTYTGEIGDIIGQLSYADSIGAKGFAGYFNYKKFTDKYLWQVYAKHIDSTYNINEVGYVTSKGDNYGAAFASIFRPDVKSIRLFSIALGTGIGKETYVNNYSKAIWSFSSLNLSNNYRFEGSFSLTDAYEDTSGTEIHYTGKGISFNMGTDHSRALSGGIWSDFSYAFNYMAYHLGYQTNCGTYLHFKPISNLLFSLNISYAGYWYDSTGIKDIIQGRNVEDSYFIFRPYMSYNFTTKLAFRMENEIVYEKSVGRVYEYRINPLIVYNVSPKSNIYLVYSLTREYNSTIDKFETTDKGAAFKIRYLFYF